MSLLCDFFSYFLNSDGTISDTALQDINQSVSPPGSYLWAATTNVGAGWLLCNGQAVSRTTYANLFAAIGTRYGAGDGSTTFNVPNAGSRSMMAAGTGSGLSTRDINSVFVGEESHLQTIAEMPSHTHEFDTSDGQQILARVTTNRVSTINFGGSLDFAYADPPQNTGGSTPFNVVHPCLIAYLFIRA